jgi:hypothetical protein
MRVSSSKTEAAGEAGMAGGEVGDMPGAAGAASWTARVAAKATVSPINMTFHPDTA